MKKKILVIDDDTYICDLLVNYLGKKGYQVEGAYKGVQGMKKIQENDYDLILCDYRLPDTTGFEVLKVAKRKNSSVPVIIMTAYADIKMSVKLIKAGASDYVTKPIHHEEILAIIREALRDSRKKDNAAYFGESFIAGKSEEIQKVLEHVKAVAPTNLSVLIEGETGSGKEYIARAIHFASKRSKKPFVPVDCGAIPKELANSELFGHVKGAFTGAIRDKKGFFEQASGGTIFLDEVGNLPHENQVKLLRALQERVISRVGENKDIEVDVRVISASNEDLLNEVRENRFREDLYHRLNGFKIHLPALRQRKEDIIEFTDKFIERANKEFSKFVEGVDIRTQESFMSYSWPGNIRELENVIKRCILLSSGSRISFDSLPEEIRNYDSSGSPVAERSAAGDVTELREATLEAEKEVITNVLRKANFNKSKAAKMLKIDRKTLYNKIKEYDIDVEKE